MPTPPISYKTVTGQYVAPDGSVVAGTLRFIPSATVYDVAGNVIVPASPVLVTLDGTGSFSVDLAATDDPDTSPTGWVWQLSELIPNGQEITFQVPAASPASVPLTTLTSALITTTTQTLSYVTTATFAALDNRVTAVEAQSAVTFAAISIHPFLLLN